MTLSSTLATGAPPRDVSGSYFRRELDFDFDSSYPTDGEAVTAAICGFPPGYSIVSVDVQPKSGYTFAYDYDNSKLKVYSNATLPATTGSVDDNDNAATVGHALYILPDRIGTTIAPLVTEGGTGTGVIKDSDTAATDGVAIYLVVDEAEYYGTYRLGHFEFVSPTAAHGTCTLFNGGPTLLLEHDAAAATNGVAVRCVAADGGLEATLAGSLGDVLVPVSDGQFMKIADATTGSTPSIYIDEDAANTYERLQATVVDNGDETYELFEGTATNARLGPQSSSRLASLVTVGPGATTSTGTVGSGGPEFTVTHDQAVAGMVGATPLYVQAAGAGFNAAHPGGETLYVPLSNGEFLEVAYAASPAGVLVYWDHDAASAHLRMLGVIVDNADETYTVSTTRSMRRDAGQAASEVANGTDLSGLTNVRVTVLAR